MQKFFFIQFSFYFFIYFLAKQTIFITIYALIDNRYLLEKDNKMDESIKKESLNRVTEAHSTGHNLRYVPDQCNFLFFL